MMRPWNWCLIFLLAGDSVAATVAPIVLPKRKFTVFDVKPAEVSFAGVSYHEVQKDDSSGGYLAPQWKDNSSPPNGSATDAGDFRFPVSYTGGSKISLSAKLLISPTPAAGTDIRVRALGPGFDFPAQVATISTGELLYPQSEATAALAQGVGFLNPMVLTWQVSTDGGAHWRKVGQTGNRVYVTLANPQATPLYETVLDIGARNASGATTADAAVAAIWADFLGPIPGVLRKLRDGFNQNDGHEMHYWLEAGDPRLPDVFNTCQTYDGMLDPTRADLNGVGTCVAWSQLFRESVRVQGIAGADIFQVRPSSSPGRMLVKNWSFAASTGTAPSSCAPFSYLESEVTDQSGAPGQGTVNPPGAFVNHFIVGYGGKWYDPSYGNGPFATQQAWENASLDGFELACPGVGIVRKKNDPNTIETQFTSP